MLIMTWFGTIVRAETATKMLIHAPLWPSGEDSADVKLDDAARDLTAPAEAAGMPDVVMEPGPAPGMLHFRRETRYLRTVPGQPALTFLDGAPDGPETFLLLEPAEAICLRVILSHAWTLEPHGGRLRPAVLSVGEGFILHLGDMRLDLSLRRPLPMEDDPGCIVLVPAAGDTPAITLRRAPAAEDLTPIVLRNGRRSPRVPEAATAEAFRVTRDRRLVLTGNPEYVAPPLTVCDTDSDWVFMRHDNGAELPVGKQILRSQVHRESGKLVLLTTDAGGLVLDAQGAASTAFRVGDMGAALPPWMQRNGDAVYIDRVAFDEAPSLHGPYIAIGHSALRDAGRGRIETLLALEILGRYAPPHAKLLLPSVLPPAQAQVAADIPAMLDVLGLAALPAVMTDRPLCRVEEAIWLEGGSLAQMPAKLLREFRARLPAVPGRKGRRILLRQNAGADMDNAATVENFAEQRGLEILTLEDFSPAEQIRLFAACDIIVAAHGPALANLVFAKAGTRVLELSPDAEFRPYYWRLAAKLGLAYAVLPCPTIGRVFEGALRVPPDRLGGLFRMLTSRL